MRDAGHRTPEKAKIIYPPPQGGGHKYPGLSHAGLHVCIMNRGRPLKGVFW